MTFGDLVFSSLVAGHFIDEASPRRSSGGGTIFSKLFSLFVFSLFKNQLIQSTVTLYELAD